MQIVGHFLQFCSPLLIFHFFASGLLRHGDVCYKHTFRVEGGGWGFGAGGGLGGGSMTHYGDVIMGTIASQIASLAIVYSTVYSGADKRKHQSSASLAFVRGFHRGPVNSPHKWPVTRKIFPFDDVIMFFDFNLSKLWKNSRVVSDLEHHNGATQRKALLLQRQESAALQTIQCQLLSTIWKHWRTTWGW